MWFQKWFFIEISIVYEKNYKFQFAKLNVGQKSTLKYVRSSTFMIPAEYKWGFYERG